MGRPLASLAGTIFALAVTAGGGHADVLQQSRAGSWAVTAYSDDASNAFARCEAESEPQSDAKLLISVDRNLAWSMGFFGKLGVSPGEAHPVSYRVDRGPLYTGVASAVSDSLVKMPITDLGAVQAIRFGRVLNVDGGNDRLTFLLRDTAAVLGEVRMCAERWRRHVATTAAVAPTNEIAKPAPRRLTDAERKLEAMTVAVNTLSRASVSGFELQPPDVPPALAGHDIIWRAQNLNGSLRVVESDGAVDVQKIRAGLISADALACEGAFSAEGTSSSGEKAPSLFTLCKSEKSWARDYLVAARPLGGAYILSVVGPSDQVDPLRAMAASLRTAAVQVVPRSP